MTSRGTTPASELVVRLRRVLPASRERVYDALTNPAGLARWWGPNGFTCPSIEFEPQVGSGYRIAMQPPEGELFHLTGEFREVSPPVRLGFTFVCGAAGTRRPGDPGPAFAEERARRHRADFGAGIICNRGTAQAARERVERELRPAPTHPRLGFTSRPPTARALALSLSSYSPIRSVHR